jgi:hypothetical protein
MMNKFCGIYSLHLAVVDCRTRDGRIGILNIEGDDAHPMVTFTPDGSGPSSQDRANIQDDEIDFIILYNGRRHWFYGTLQPDAGKPCTDEYACIKGKFTICEREADGSLIIRGDDDWIGNRPPVT